MLTPVLGLLKYARHVPALGAFIRYQSHLTCDRRDRQYVFHPGCTAWVGNWPLRRLLFRSDTFAPRARAVTNERNAR
jgi:hypothetical protein